jgi:BirA family biotin operon repressor/biotin-[acetyl-CoA-carboxylase] ligase
VAAAEALQSFVPDVRLKYPNDLILEGAKLGGILVDSATGENRLAWLVIGIGINIETAPDVAEQNTIALADRGIHLAPQDLAIRLLERVAAWRYIIECEGFAAVRRAWSGWALDPAGARAHLQQWGDG